MWHHNLTEGHNTLIYYFKNPQTTNINTTLSAKNHHKSVKIAQQPNPTRTSTTFWRPKFANLKKKNTELQLQNSQTKSINTA